MHKRFGGFHIVILVFFTLAIACGAAGCGAKGDPFWTSGQKEYARQKTHKYRSQERSGAIYRAETSGDFREIPKTRSLIATAFYAPTDALSPSVATEQEAFYD
ncbi:MAG: hypothetical protein LBU73_06865 [Helicobacteraceae bacterium]|jgi:hypothetical protein|nr:hypothetical protein [Helicobacteraceae bacterium]